MERLQGRMAYPLGLAGYWQRGRGMRWKSWKRWTRWGWVTGVVLGWGSVQAEGLDVRSQFLEPPLEYATRPLWFWNNTAVTESGIVAQMEQARDLCGYGGFGILPFGEGFRPEYLSEEYFRLYGVALEKARSLGMVMCIYDEYGFPSGSAGAINGDGVRRFADRHPGQTIKRLDMHAQEVSGPAVWSSDIPSGELMAVVAMETGTLQRIDLTERVTSGRLEWRVPVGNWRVMVFVCVVDGDPNVDYLDPVAVGLFVEMTHQQYYDRFKEYFGSTITGTFHDEPTMYRAQGRIWTGSFNRKFEAKHGFDPRPYYPALWHDIGPETAAARNYLFGFRTELYATGFPKVIQDWAERHGIAATGHQDQEEVVNPVSVSGDLMKCFQHQAIPGVDKIGGPRPAERFYKLISSAAYNWDKPLVMSETYGAMGDIAWETIYGVAMEQYTKGVNLLIPHAVWYDPDAVTFKPELSWRHEGYAGGLRGFNRYMSRLNLLLQNSGRHVADIAVLYPIATLQAGHFLDGPLGPYQGGVEIPEADYVELGELLTTRVGRDFTYLHPEVLDGACRVEGECLYLANANNHERYRVMILPAHKAIRWSNLSKIQAFFDAGGKVIVTGCLPQQSAEFGHDSDVIRAVDAMFPGVRSSLARNPRVTGSSAWPGYEPGLAMDGDLTTRWNAADGTSGDQWLEIDLGGMRIFDTVSVTEVFDRVTSFSLQVHDGADWVDCATGTELGVRTLRFEPVRGERVRLLIHTIKADSVSIAELSVLHGDRCLTGGASRAIEAEFGNARGGLAVFLERPTAASLRECLDRMVDVYDVAFEPGQTLRYIHKVWDGRDIYLFANLEESRIAGWVTLRGRRQWELWDPHTGGISEAKQAVDGEGAGSETRVWLELDPLESIFVVGSGRGPEA